jgi:hypothetical protein
VSKTLKVMNPLLKTAKVDKIEDLLIRLKTTNASSDKFGDTVGIIHELLLSENQTWAKQELGDKPRPIRTQLKNPEHLKFVLKGLSAKNEVALL